MKYYFTMTAFLLIGLSAYGQDCNPSTAYIELDANNIKAGLQLTGDLWWDGSSEPKYIAPKPAAGQPEVSALFVGGLWMAGYDSAGNLKAAISQYPSGNITDYWPGPLNDEGEIAAGSCANWDRFFPITATQVADHLADFADNGVIDDPIPEVFGWPGRNNSFMSQYHGFMLPTDRELAPYVDNNGNGRYDPDQGEIPKMKGTQSIYWVFNDAGNTHLASTANELNVDVQVMAYAEASSLESVNNTTFYDFKITNRGIDKLNDFYLGLYLDPDLGCFTDDIVGYDTTRHMAFIYNEDEVDGTVGSTCQTGVNTYGTAIPMLGIAPIAASFDYVENSSFVLRQPAPNPPPFEPTTTNYYNLLAGGHSDGLPLTFGGDGYNPGSTDTVQYVLTGEPSDPDGWSMCTADLPWVDARVHLNTGGIVIAQNESIEITYAVLFVEDVPHPCPSLDQLRQAYDEVTDNLPLSTNTTEVVSETAHLTVSPNPTTGSFQVQAHGSNISNIVVTDVNGREVYRTHDLDGSILLDHMPDGLYIVSAYSLQQQLIVSEKLVKISR